MVLPGYHIKNYGVDVHTIKLHELLFVFLVGPTRHGSFGRTLVGATIYSS